MDPTACLNEIIALQLQLTTTGKTVDQLIREHNDTYYEWVDRWKDLIEWLRKGGFPPELNELPNKQLLSPNCHGMHTVVIHGDKAPFTMTLYTPQGDKVNSWTLSFTT